MLNMLPVASLLSPRTRISEKSSQNSDRNIVVIIMDKSVENRNMTHKKELDNNQTWRQFIEGGATVMKKTLKMRARRQLKREGTTYDSYKLRLEWNV